MKNSQIYVGDFVKLDSEYFREWKCDSESRLRDLRKTVFMVVDSGHCYSWRYGMRGGGEILTLKPVVGPLAETGLMYGRADNAVKKVDPSTVDRFLSEQAEQREAIDEEGISI